MNMENLGAFFKAQQQMQAYKNTKLADRTIADVNNDGVIDKKDKEIIEKQLNQLKALPSLYDLSGDSKIDINDLILVSRNIEIDLDGDGKVSDEEKAFMNEQQKELQKKLISDLKKNVSIQTLADFSAILESADDKDKEKLQSFLKDYEKTMFTELSNKSFSKLTDVNGDGKVTYDDYQQYKEIKAKYQAASNANGENVFATGQGYKLDNAFKTLDAKMKQIFDVNYGQNNYVNQNDLAKMIYLQNQAQVYLSGQKGAFGKLTQEELVKKFDFNQDGVFDEKDIASSKTGVSNLMEILGIKDANNDGVLDEKDITYAGDNLNKAKEEQAKKDAAYKDATTQKNDAKKAQNAATTVFNGANTALSKAEKANNNAIKAVNDAQTKLDQLKAKYDELVEQLAANPKNSKLAKDIQKQLEKINNQEKVLADAKLKQQETQKTYDDAKVAYDKAKQDLDVAKEKYSAAAAAYETAKAELDKAKSDTKAANTEAAKFNQYNTEFAKQENAAKSEETKKINKAETAYTKAKDEYDKAKAAYDKALEKYNSAKESLDKAKEDNEKAIATVQSEQNKLDELNKQLEQMVSEYAQDSNSHTIDEIIKLQNEIKSQETVLEKAKTAADKAEDNLTAMQDDFNAKESTLKKKETTLNQKETILSDKKKDLEFLTD